MDTKRTDTLGLSPIVSAAVTAASSAESVQRDWKLSPMYQQFVEAQLYYHNITRIRNKGFVTKICDTTERTNTRICSGVFKDIIDQIVDYLLAAEPEPCTYPVSAHTLRQLAIDYLVTGQAVLGLKPDTTGGDHQLVRFAPESVCPWDNTKWFGYDVMTPISLYGGGVDNPLEIDRATSSPFVSSEPTWWTSIRRASTEPTIYELIAHTYIDAYELLLSRKQDALADAPNSPIIVQGYLDNPDEFVNRTREDGVVFLSVDGKMSVLDVGASIDMTAIDDQLERLLTAAYNVSGAVRPIADRLQRLDSSVSLRLLYATLDNKARALGDTLRELLSRAAEEGAITGSPDSHEITFTMSSIVNETEIMTNAAQATAYLSREALVSKCPWIADKDEELKRPSVQQEAAQQAAETQREIAISRTQGGMSVQQKNRANVQKGNAAAGR